MIHRGLHPICWALENQMLMAEDFFSERWWGWCWLGTGACFSQFLPFFSFLPSTLSLRTIQGVLLLIRGGSLGVLFSLIPVWREPAASVEGKKEGIWAWQAESDSRLGDTELESRPNTGSLGGLGQVTTPLWVPFSSFVKCEHFLPHKLLARDERGFVKRRWSAWLEWPWRVGLVDAAVWQPSHTDQDQAWVWLRWFPLEGCAEVSVCMFVLIGLCLFLCEWYTFWTSPCRL